MLPTDDDMSEKTPLLGSVKRNQAEPEKTKEDIPFPSCRQVLALVGFLGMINLYTLRTNLSVALVSMVLVRPDNSTITDTECLPEARKNITLESVTRATGEFYWTKQQQGVILGAFFYGYVTTQFMGGRLGERFGGKHVFGTGILMTSLLTLLTPLAARQSWILLVVLRILEGMFSGVVFPTTHAILSKWAPPYERTKLGVAIYTGTYIGIVLAMSLSGVLVASFGWPSVFYVFGLMGCIWWIMWLFLMYSTPGQHPRISPAERTYIEGALKIGKYTRPHTPWYGILTSLPFWAILINCMTNNWGYYMLLTCLPQYMNDILHFNISSNGLLSALPYLFGWIVVNIAGPIVDHLRARGIARTVVVRKVATLTAQILPAIFLILAGSVGCNRELAVVFIILAGGCIALATSGSSINHLDIAPRFAGTLYGLTNTTAGIPGIIAPLAVTALTQKENTREQWMLIFYITAVIYGCGALFYLIFAAGVEQEWAKAPDAPILSRNIDVSVEDTDKTFLIRSHQSIS